MVPNGLDYSRLDKNRRFLYTIGVACIFIIVIGFLVKLNDDMFNVFLPEPQYALSVATQLASDSVKHGSYPTAVRLHQDIDSACEEIPGLPEISSKHSVVNTFTPVPALMEIAVDKAGQMCITVYVYEDPNRDSTKDPAYYKMVRRSNYLQVFGDLPKEKQMVQVLQIKKSLAGLDLRPLRSNHQVPYLQRLYQQIPRMFPLTAQPSTFNSEDYEKFITELRNDVQKPKHAILRIIKGVQLLCVTLLLIVSFYILVLYEEYLGHAEDYKLKFRWFVLAPNVETEHQRLQQLHQRRLKLELERQKTERELAAINRKLIELANMDLRSLIPQFPEDSEQRTIIQRALESDMGAKERASLYRELADQVQSVDTQAVNRERKITDLCLRLWELTPDETKARETTEQACTAAMRLRISDYARAKQILVTAIDQRRRLNENPTLKESAEQPTNQG